MINDLLLNTRTLICQGHDSDVTQCVTQNLVQYSCSYKAIPSVMKKWPPFHNYHNLPTWIRNTAKIKVESIVLHFFLCSVYLPL